MGAGEQGGNLGSKVAVLHADAEQPRTSASVPSGNRTYDLVLKDKALEISAIPQAPVHFWAVATFLHELRALILRISPGRLAGVFSYAASFALMEVLVPLAAMAIIGLGIRPSLVRKYFPGKCTALFMLTMLWAVLDNENALAIRWWSVEKNLLFAGCYLLTAGLVIALVHRMDGLASGVKTLSQRIAPLAAIFLATDLFGVLVVILRNPLRSSY